MIVIGNSFLEVENVQVSASISDFNEAFKKFRLTVDNVRFSAQFSDYDWIKTLTLLSNDNDGATESAFPLPFAYVGVINFAIQISSKRLESSCSLRLQEFHGDSDTSLYHICNHYKALLVRRISSFIYNLKVMGGDITETTVVGIGSMVMNCVPLESLICLVFLDLTAKIVKAGKESRGVPKDEPCELGDFSAGVLQLLYKVAKKGRQRRIQDGSPMMIQDFIHGLTILLKRYIRKNKYRFSLAVSNKAITKMALESLGSKGHLVGMSQGTIIKFVPKFKSMIKRILHTIGQKHSEEPSINKNQK
jgi:hypothetical protein